MNSCYYFIPSPVELPPVGVRGRTSSYEDFKQSKLQETGGGAPMSSGRSDGGSVPASPTPSFGIRKAKSDPDINKHNMMKDLEVLMNLIQLDTIVLCTCTWAIGHLSLFVIPSFPPSSLLSSMYTVYCIM